MAVFNAMASDWQCCIVTSHMLSSASQLDWNSNDRYVAPAQPKQMCQRGDFWRTAACFANVELRFWLSYLHLQVVQVEALEGRRLSRIVDRRHAEAVRLLAHLQRRGSCG